MLEYFTYKKMKKHQAEKQAAKAPVLSPVDEAFLQRITSEESAPALPARPPPMSEVGDPTGNTSQIAVIEGPKGKEQAKDQKKSNRFSFLQRSGTKKVTAPSPRCKLIKSDSYRTKSMQTMDSSRTLRLTLLRLDKKKPTLQRYSRA